MPIKRNIKNEISANLLLFILSPYLIFNLLLTISYEHIYGFKKTERQIKKESHKKFKYELAVVSISKNEGLYLLEWIEFHRIQGVEKFYFYDNESEDNTAELLRPYIEAGIVEYTFIKGKGQQLKAYNDAIRKHKNECRWMAFLDMDEYLGCTDERKTIVEIVNRIIKKAGRGAAGIGVNWATYGTSGLKKRPKGLIIENYVMRAENDSPINAHVKTICNPRFVANYISPHYPFYKRGAYSICEAVAVRQWGWYANNRIYKNLRINHYYTKSEEDYIYKISRGLGDRIGKYDEAQPNKYDKNNIYDDIFCRCVQELKIRIESYPNIKNSK